MKFCPLELSKVVLLAAIDPVPHTRNGSTAHAAAKLAPGLPSCAVNKSAITTMLLTSLPCLHAGELTGGRTQCASIFVVVVFYDLRLAT